MQTMHKTATNLRKAAVLIRSLDADSAAAVLSRLSPEEAKQVRLAIQSLGEVDAEERADVSAEFCRSGTVARENPRHAVELELSSTSLSLVEPANDPPGRTPISGSSRPFDFLEHARVESLVPYLSREQAQTVAVVLSYLPPDRAAEVLAALPAKLAAATIERLSMLGETDPSALQVLERELADWVARQRATRTRPLQRVDTVNTILAAAGPAARDRILANLVQHNRALADRLTPTAPRSTVQSPTVAEQIADCGSQIAELRAAVSAPAQSAIRNPQPAIPQFRFDDLARFDTAGLTSILRAVDSDVLVLALVGASEELVGRITSQMPAKVAKAFRQRLHRCGPTRLRDVEDAQFEVARIAAQIVHAQRTAARTAVA